MVQLPQCRLLSVKSTQAPPLHIVVPVGQFATQDPPLQTLVTPVHVVPQLPQLLESEGTQAPPHWMLPVEHWHLPAMHVWVAEQAVPHAPQLS